VTLGIEHGIKRMDGAAVIALFAAAVCRPSACTPDQMVSVVISVGVVSVALGVLVCILFPSASLRPGKVTDEELTELKMLGYIVMEGEEPCLYDDNGHCPYSDPDDRCAGCDPESVKLDSPRDSRGGTEAEIEDVGELAEVH